DTDWVRRFLTESAARLAASRRAAGDPLPGLDLGDGPPAPGVSPWGGLRGGLTQPTLPAGRPPWGRLFDAAPVHSLPGAVFSAPEAGWFRLCHAVDPALVREGVARLATALGAATPRRSA